MTVRKWLHDNPWIWIVVLLGAVVIGGLTTVVIAQLNRPEIVKPRKGAAAPGTRAAAERAVALAQSADRAAGVISGTDGVAVTGGDRRT